MPAYTIRKASQTPTLQGLWDTLPWTQAETLEIRHFRPESSDHRPRALVRVLHDDKGLYVHFRVEDRYVRAVHTQYQDSVCHDSCAEFFVEPRAGKGYFNFEINCAGTLLVSYIEDHQRVPGGFRKFQRLAPDFGKMIRIFHSLPSPVEPEITEPVTWQIEYFIPFALFEAFVGPLGNASGQTWRANFYKCGDETSHPHWASWAPIGEALNFHLPEYFAPIHIE